MTDKQKSIFADLTAAINMLWDVKINAPGESVSRADIKRIMPAFDMLRLVVMDDVSAIERVAHLKAECVRAAYQEHVLAHVDTDYSLDDIYVLQATLKNILKNEKIPGKLPARLLYIADTHFYHNRLCQEMDQRGFNNYEEMNAYMIEKWNEKVTPKDEVYILGDFSIAKGEATNAVLKQLKGKKHLIIGNHDRYLEDRRFDLSLYRSVQPYKEVRDQGRSVILSHYPVICYNGQYRRGRDGEATTYMLYGHTHNTQDEERMSRFIRLTRETLAASRHRPDSEPIPCNMINCFCVFSGYQPMTLDEWIRIDAARRNKMYEEESKQ